MAERPYYTKPTRSSSLLKQGSMGDVSHLKEVLELNITTWQREVALKRMKSVLGAHLRTPEGDEPSEECICEPPPACLFCKRQPDTLEGDLLYAYQGLKDPAKDAEPIF